METQRPYRLATQHQVKLERCLWVFITHWYHFMHLQAISLYFNSILSHPESPDIIALMSIITYVLIDDVCKDYQVKGQAIAHS